MVINDINSTKEGIEDNLIRYDNEDQHAKSSTMIHDTLNQSIIKNSNIVYSKEYLIQTLQKYIKMSQTDNNNIRFYANSNRNKSVIMLAPRSLFNNRKKSSIDYQYDYYDLPDIIAEKSSLNAYLRYNLKPNDIPSNLPHYTYDNLYKKSSDYATYNQNEIPSINMYSPYSAYASAYTNTYGHYQLYHDMMNYIYALESQNSYRAWYDHHYKTSQNTIKFDPLAPDFFPNSPSNTSNKNTSHHQKNGVDAFISDLEKRHNLSKTSVLKLVDIIEEMRIKNKHHPENSPSHDTSVHTADMDRQKIMIKWLSELSASERILLKKILEERKKIIPIESTICDHYNTDTQNHTDNTRATVIHNVDKNNKETATDIGSKMHSFHEKYTQLTCNNATHEPSEQYYFDKVNKGKNDNRDNNRDTVSKSTVLSTNCNEFYPDQDHLHPYSPNRTHYGTNMKPYYMEPNMVPYYYQQPIPYPGNYYIVAPCYSSSNYLTHYYNKGSK